MNELQNRLVLTLVEALQKRDINKALKVSRLIKLLKSRGKK